jgi:hypothetical protein
LGVEQTHIFLKKMFLRISSSFVGEHAGLAF